MNLDEAVNNALDDIDLVENERFIDLMTALYFHIENTCDGIVPSGDEKIDYDAIGYFVPSEKTNAN